MLVKNPISQCLCSEQLIGVTNEASEIKSSSKHTNSATRSWAQILPEKNILKHKFYNSEILRSCLRTKPEAHLHAFLSSALHQAEVRG